MMHEGKRIDDEVERLRRELEKPIGVNRRVEIQAAINRLKAKKQEWERPH